MLYYFFCLAKCFIAYQKQIHASSCYTGVKWFLSQYETIFQPDRYWNMCSNHLGFSLELFSFLNTSIWVSFFFQCLLFLALFTSSLFDIASYSSDLCSILGVFLLLLFYFRIIQLYLRHSIEIKQIGLFLLLLFSKHVSYIAFAIISNNKTNERKLKIVSLLSNLSAVISFT